MEVNFAKIDFKKRPNFILKDMDLNIIANLSRVLNPTGVLSFTELSEIKFEYPKMDNGVKVEEYDLLTDMRVLEVQGYGQFIMRNCQVIDDGIIEKKSCTFYSLEYEFSMKPFAIEEGTYNFWNPLAPKGTVIQMILDAMPSWGLSKTHSFPADLIGKYRTFSVDNTTVYDFMKSDVQQKFGCIIDFDTYNREIIIRSAFQQLNPKPVYIGKTNLAKEIEANTRTDEMITALDVNGAEGVNIRSVNPLGTNRIYNLDYYLTTDYFSSDFISKWNAWKANYENYQQTYYDLVIERQMQMSRYQTETAALGTLNAEMQVLEKQRAVIIQAMANDSALQTDLDTINRQISEKQRDINDKSAVLSQIEDSIARLTNQLKAINTLTSFETFFNASEISTLNKYFRCGTLTDSSFVASNVNSYSTDTVTSSLSSAIFNLTDLTTLRKETHDSNITFYTLRGGKIQQSNDSFKINANIVNGTLQVNNDLSFVFSLYLSNGNLSGVEFPSGTLSMIGKISGISTPDSSTLQFRVNDATVFLTQAVTEYQRMSIEWELYEYGVKSLAKMATPTYSFKVSSINFLTLDEFIAFSKQFSLGEQLYLHIGDKTYHPIVVSVSIEFDNPEALEIDFGDEYHYNNGDMTYQDLVELGVSMGSSLDFNQFNYSNFVNSGAQTSVRRFMESAIDTMRNAILSGDHNEMTIDPTGLRMRKYDEETGDYDPRQVWATYNSIMFTSDNWQHAEIGIGEFVDKNLGSLFGIVAPAIVGTILAGTQLVIESEKQDGGVAVFKMDAEGASLHNASFNLYGATGGRIDLGADFGIVGGGDKNTLFVYNDKGQPIGVKTKKGDSVVKIADIDDDDETNASFWVDMFGDALFRGTVYATDGVFNGTVYAKDGEFSGDISGARGTFKGTVQAEDFLNANGESMMKNGKWDSNYLDLGNIILDGETGDISMTGNLNLSELSSITWNSKTAPVKYQYSVNGTSGWHTTMNASDMYRRDSLDGGVTWGSAYQFRGKDGKDGEDGSDADVTFNNILAALKKAAETEHSFITATELGAPNIYGANIYGAKVYSNNFTVKPEKAASSGSWNGGFTLCGYYGSEPYDMMQISYFEGDAPYVLFQSPAQAYARWNFPHTDFMGVVDFSKATVTGIDATAKFG